MVSRADVYAQCTVAWAAFMAAELAGESERAKRCYRECDRLLEVLVSLPLSDADLHVPLQVSGSHDSAEAAAARARGEQGT